MKNHSYKNVSARINDETRSGLKFWHFIYELPLLIDSHYFSFHSPKMLKSGLFQEDNNLFSRRLMFFFELSGNGAVDCGVT